MKKIVVFLFIMLPWIVVAQNNCDFFTDVTFDIENAAFNTKVSDFGPAIVDDVLWFSSFTDKEIDKISRGVRKKVFYNTFSAALSGDDLSERKVELEEISENFHAGPVSYCKATGELFVTLSNIDDPDVKYTVFQKANIRLKIIIVKKINGEWTYISDFPLNSKEYSVGHPSVSATGDTLFFVSNMPDKGNGKTDIYMAVRENGIWGEAKNLGSRINSNNDEMFPFWLGGNTLIFAARPNGKPDLDLFYSCYNNGSFGEPQPIDGLNSNKDDFGLVINTDGKTGYFTSQRLGGKGDDDIYKINISKNIVVKGKVIEDDSEIAVVGASVNLIDCNGEKIAEGTSDEDGNFSFKIIENDCLNVEANKAPLIPGKEKVKDNFAVVRLRGNYNLELLVKDKNTGKVLPDVPVKFSDSGLAATDKNGLLKRKLEPKTDYVVSTELGEDFMNESAEFTTKKQPYGTIKRVLQVEKVELGQTFELKKIYYDFDKWDILPESATELDKLVKILNDNPTWKVELGSHTDCRGRDEYNKWLSQKRSDAAVKYIVDKGIAKLRIVAKGYGETQLINKCDDGVPCSEAEHRKNRRTEFKILEIN